MSPPATAAIVLAGGQSTRMGRPKALLEWHGSTLARRAVGVVGRVVDGPVVVVRAAGQALPALPPGIELADDARHARGPLQGMAAGLRALGDRAAVVFVTGVDAPLLHPVLVAHVIASLGPDDDVALPHAHGFPHPLAAAYRAATVAPLIDALLAAESLGTRPLMRRCRVRRLDEAALLADPAVAALVNDRAVTDPQEPLVARDAHDVAGDERLLRVGHRTIVDERGGVAEPRPCERRRADRAAALDRHRRLGAPVRGGVLVGLVEVLQRE